MTDQAKLQETQKQKDVSDVQDFSPEKTSQKLLDEANHLRKSSSRAQSGDSASGHLPNVVFDKENANQEAGKQAKGGGEGEKNSGIKEANKKHEMLEELDRIKNKLGKLDSVQDLPTGDTLVRVGGKEVLLMPNGDRLIIYPSGAFDLKSKGEVRITSKGGMTTLSYPNGDTVSFDEQGLLSIHRGKEGVAFGRMRQIKLPDGIPVPGDGQGIPDRAPEQRPRPRSGESQGSGEAPPPPNDRPVKPYEKHKQ